MKNQPEFLMQKQICRYIEIQYPNVLFISDTGSGAKLTQAQAMRNKSIQKKDYKNPDVQIIHANKEWHGLFLELKKETPYKKTGGLKKKLVTIYKTIAKKRVAVGSYDHLQLQDDSLKKLRDRGYMACFCWSFEMAKEIIDNYLK